MVSIIQRMRKLRALLSIRLGPGAALLPKDIKRIHLSFAQKFNDGHLGPRKFWRTHLPRLKYHNPAVSMTVYRMQGHNSPATLTVFFAPAPASGSPTASPAPSESTSAATALSEHRPAERVVAVNVKHMREGEILARLMEVTGGVAVVATEEEEEELRVVGEERVRSERDAARSAEVNERRRRRDELLALARVGVEEEARA